jgi:tetratricopeptide (TPR) repeat protein
MSDAFLGPSERAAMTRRFGVFTLDRMVPHWRCPRCSAPVPAREVWTVGTVTYRNADEFMSRSNQARATLTAPGHKPPGCAGCAVAATGVAADYHAFHSGLALDLVARWLPHAATPTLFHWNGAHYTPAPALSASERTTLTRDALLRAAEATRATQGLEAALEDIRAALRALQDDRALLHFVRPLMAAGRNGLAGEILDARVAAAPDDLEAQCLHADLTLRLVNLGLWTADHLPDAEARLARVLALDPAHFEATNARCLLLRMQGRSDEALAGYREIVRRRPDLAAPLYNVGAMLLASAPAEARECFERGEALAPGDADYPLGVARACLALGLLAECRAALSRAERLAPADSRVRAVAEELARRTDPTH